jgi:glycosyltransferase involved in cell wall biosynthesis
MRILNFIPNLSGGGAERQLSYLATELVNREHDVHIAYIKDGPQKPELKGVILYKLKACTNYDPNLIWQMLLLIRRIKPDIIHTWILQMDILGGILARFTRTPWVFREQTSKVAYIGTFKQRIRAIIGTGAHAVISNSQGGDEYWEARLGEPFRFVITNGIPLSEIEGAENKLPIGLTNLASPIILFVGRLIESKNPKTFINVIANIKRQHNVIGILCGDGPQRNEIEELKRTLSLDKEVYITGYLPPTQIWSLMRKASVFVSFSTHEGCPNAVMEAMACNCPLVISDIPAHREFLDEKCAVFVDTSSDQLTTQAILNALHNMNDTNSRRIIAKQRTYAWSISEMAHHYEIVYKKILSIPE